MTLQSRLLLETTPALHAFSLRGPKKAGWGNMSLVIGSMDAAIENRMLFLRGLGLGAGDLAFAYQEHGTQIHRVHEADRGRGATRAEDRLPPADGLVTNVPGLAVGVLVADCCCLLAADIHGRAVGAFHAGWRGTMAGMAVHAVETFQSEFGIAPGDLRFWISPAICGLDYTVGKDVWERFRCDWGGGTHLLADPPRIDLPALNEAQLVAAGVTAGGIEQAGLCTFESPGCFSHRRGDEVEGRMLGAISLPKSPSGDGGLSASLLP